MIDLANGVAEAATVIRANPDASISVMTWIEAMAGVRNSSEEATMRWLLRRLKVLPLTTEVAKVAAEIRRERRLKLPDAIILATARVHGLTLVTRNTKDFPSRHPSIRIPYQL